MVALHCFVGRAAGIQFENEVGRGRIDRLDIDGNRISFAAFAGDSADADKISVGIGVSGVEDVLRIGALSIASNTVHNALGPCIFSTAVFGPMEASRIADNTLVDCARSINLVGAGDVLRSAIIVAVKTSHLSIAGNMIEASGAVPVALPKS